MISRAVRSALWVLLCFCVLGQAKAHEVRPGYLELRRLDERHYDVPWKVPAKDDRRLALYVRLPDNCKRSEPITRFVGGAFLERWRADCEVGLTVQEVTIDRLSATRTDVLARVERPDGGTQTVRLTPEADLFRLTGTSSTLAAVKTYTGLGIEHILLGNVGIEIGQLGFILVVLTLAKSFRLLELHWPRWSEAFAVYLLGSVATCWFIERTVLMVQL